MRFRSRGRFNFRRWSRILADRVRGTPFERAVSAAKREGRHDFVFGWNRGLGDIALGLVPLFARIRASDPRSRIVVFTRADLADAFRLTDADAVHVVATATRGPPIDVRPAAAAAGVALPPAATVFADPDPTRWLDGRRQAYPPALRWDPAWNARADRLVPAIAGTVDIGAHVSSETAQHYGYVKDWPAASWRELIARFPAERGVRWLLLGNEATTAFPQSNVVDLRGRTDFLDLVALVRARCRILVAPDSGVLTAAYYLAQDFPLEVVSLWSDPRQGILKQGCSSPNPRLVHAPLVGRDEDVRNLRCAEVERALAAALDRCVPAARAARADAVAS
ncbi:MAG: glycosyltransferase family 9 protein [Burkholderiales bacterium]